MIEALLVVLAGFIARTLTQWGQKYVALIKPHPKVLVIILSAIAATLLVLVLSWSWPLLFLACVLASLGVHELIRAKGW